MFWGLNKVSSNSVLGGKNGLEIEKISMKTILPVKKYLRHVVEKNGKEYKYDTLAWLCLIFWGVCLKRRETRSACGWSQWAKIYISTKLGLVANSTKPIFSATAHSLIVSSLSNPDRVRSKIIFPEKNGKHIFGLG